MSISASYKPSPLSFNSPRASPFRRPESPASPSPLRNSTTPTTSPTKAMGTPNISPSKLNNGNSSSTTDARTWTPRGLVASISSERLHSNSDRMQVPREREPPLSPTRGANSPHLDSSPTLKAYPPRPATDTNSLSKLQPSQVRELRESFQILDRDSDGVVGREDVADMLSQLGLPTDTYSLSKFFPQGTPQTLTLPSFLTQISAQLSALSPPSELLSAFAAFDEEDSGQVDLGELKEALRHAVPEAGEAQLSEGEIERIVNGFSGRRAFGGTRGSMMMHSGGGGVNGMTKRGEVFRYVEFVRAVSGGKGDGKEEEGRRDE